MTGMRSLWRCLLASLAAFALLPTILDLEAAPADDSWTFIIGLFAAITFTTGVASIAAYRIKVVRPIESGAMSLTDPGHRQHYYRIAAKTWVTAEIPAFFGVMVLVTAGRTEAFYAFILWGAFQLLLQTPREQPRTTLSTDDLARSDVKIG